MVCRAGVIVIENLAFGYPEAELLELRAALGAPTVSSGRGPLVEHLSNGTGVPVEQRNAAVEWHQDGIHTEQPGRFTLLYGLEAPTHPPATVFADLASAYEALPPSRRRQLDGLRVVHDPVGGRVRSPGEARGRAGHTGPTVAHPIRLRHPTTGRDQLFGVAGTAAGIEGLPDEAAIRLLRELKSHATGKAFTWSATVHHQTLLIWDNLRLLHMATPVRYSNTEGERRHLLRAAVEAPLELAGDLGAADR